MVLLPHLETVGVWFWLDNMPKTCAASLVALAVLVPCTWQLSGAGTTVRVSPASLCPAPRLRVWTGSLTLRGGGDAESVMGGPKEWRCVGDNEKERRMFKEVAENLLMGL